MAEHYETAKNIESATETARAALKAFVSRLVGYPCKVACEPTETGVDLVVLNEKKGKVMDYLEIQSSGAVGVLDGEYEDKDLSRADALWERCETINTQANVTYEVGEGDEDSESDSEEEEEVSDEEQ